MFKKGLILCLSAVSLVACQVEEGGKKEEANNEIANNEGPLEIVASTTQVADLLEIVGGDHVEVTNLMGPGVDPHEYQAKTSDIEALSNAQVIAFNGVHLEAMMDDALHQIEAAGNPAIKVEDALDDDQLIIEDEGEPDPHVWFSIDIWSEATDHFAKELGELDSEHKEIFQANADDFKEELEELRTYTEERIEEIPEKQRVLVTAHDAFSYFGKEFGIEVLGIQGMNTQTEAGTSDISKLAEYIVENDIQSVFVESSVGSRNIEALMEAVKARGHNIELGGELYSDALGSPEEDAGTYIGMYKANVDTIVDALK